MTTHQEAWDSAIAILKKHHISGFDMLKLYIHLPEEDWHDEKKVLGVVDMYWGTDYQNDVEKI